MTHYILEDLRDEGYHISTRRVVAYTDGACLGNGRGGAQGGIGVSWGNDNDISEPLPGSVQTNQRAELEAVLRAIETHPNDNVDLEIRTDSRYVETCCANYAEWRDNYWTNRSGKPVANLDLVERLADHLDHGYFDVLITHVRGHSTSKGNRRADYLARTAAEQARNNNRSYYSSDSDSDW